MTLNVPLNNQGIPLALASEVFMLYRKNIEFEVKIDNLGKKTLKGTVHLTSFRIIFVNDTPTPDFYSFDIPIASLFNEDVQFPLFGATYLRGSCHPYQNLLPGNCHFKLWFKNGGCDTFIKVLSVLIKENRKYQNQNTFMQQSPVYNEIRNGQFNFNAFVDPNDPTHVYAKQPNI